MKCLKCLNFECVNFELLISRSPLENSVHPFLNSIHPPLILINESLNYVYPPLILVNESLILVKGATKSTCFLTPSDLESPIYRQTQLV